MKNFLFIIMAAILAVSLCACVPSGQMCNICDQKKATHQYTNAFGTTIYACSDCYKEVKKLSE